MWQMTLNEHLTSDSLKWMEEKYAVLKLKLNQVTYKSKI